MAGSKKSTIVFAIATIMFVIQMIVSIAQWGDYNGALLGFAFVIIMTVSTAAAWKGGLMTVREKESEYQSGPYTRTEVWKDTGMSVQVTPCCGICAGIMSIIVVFLAGESIIGTGEFIFLTPGILGGILAIIAAIIFIFDYKGPWSLQRF